MIRASAKRELKRKPYDARPSRKLRQVKCVVECECGGLGGLKVKVPSGVHVGNTATPSCCCGGNAEQLVAPGQAQPQAQGQAYCPARGARGPGPGLGCPAPGPAPGRRLVKGPGLVVKGLVAKGLAGSRPGVGHLVGGVHAVGAAPGPGRGPGRRAGGWLLSRSNCPCTDSAKCPSESCFMFMFRNRRNTLAKRLWNARVLQRDHAERREAQGAGAGVGGQGAQERLQPPSQEALLRNSFLKRLKDPQLETLLQAVESRGAMLTNCVLLERETQLEPHLLCCQIWRWPELQRGSELRRLPICSSSTNPAAVCCNPYHWSRLCKPGECRQCSSRGLQLRYIVRCTQDW